MSRYKPPWPTNKGKIFPQKHHITPSSRGGGDGYRNILNGIPSDDHWAWHKLFGNLTPIEIMTVLVKHLFKGGTYREYRRSIHKQASAPPSISPDRIILALVHQVFPKNWVPSDKLMSRLKRLIISRKRES